MTDKLISVNEIKSKLIAIKNNAENYSEYPDIFKDAIDEVISLVDAQPTAYDIEDKCKELRNSSIGAEVPNSIAELNYKDYIIAIELSKALDIVKGMA